MEKIIKSDEEWKTLLTPEQYSVLRKKGTERPFSGEYDEYFGAGTYICAGCTLPLFKSDEKYNSSCGWPAFTEAVEKGAVDKIIDKSHGMLRTEVVCAQCDGHLGHVFNDGPSSKGGLRYCINSVALQFLPQREA